MEKREVAVSNADDLMKNKERGASLVEYAVLVGIILTVAIIGVQAFGGQVSNAFNSIGTELENQVP